LTLGRTDPIDWGGSTLDAPLAQLQQHFIGNFCAALGDVFRTTHCILRKQLRSNADKKTSQAACSDCTSRIMFIP
jgi:hypothetical protein